MGIAYLTEHIHEEAQIFLSLDQITMLYLCTVLALLGLVWGSFADCAVSRWAEGKKGMKLFSGRSHCLSCGHELGLVDLIPVAGYLIRRGKCRYCGEKIPADCLIAELAGAVSFVLIGIHFGENAELALWYLLYSGRPDLLFTGAVLIEWVIWAAIMLALSLTDAAKRIIPDRLLIALAVNRVVFFFLRRQDISVVWDVLRAFIVPAVLLALVLLAEKLLDREVMGGGDIKLLFVLALYLSWAQLLLTLLAGCILGLVFAVLARKKQGTAMPFGPFLAVGALVVVCFGDPLIQWYFSLF